MRSILLKVSGVISLSLVSSLALAEGNYLHDVLDSNHSGRTYQFDLKYITEDLTVRAHFDPQRSIGKRLTIVEPSQADLLKQLEADIASLESEVQREFWCSDFYQMIPRNAKLVSQDEISATYRFTPVADADDAEDAMMMSNLTGVVVVSKLTPIIQRFHLRAPQPFKPTWFVKVLSLEVNAKCVPSPDGRSRIKTFEMELDGKVALRRFRDYEYREISNVQR